MSLSRQEFERLALEQLDLVYRMARRLARDTVQAEDLVQETYLRAFRARKTFQLEEFGIRPWLLRILHNLHLSRVQREKRQPLAVEDKQLEATPHANSDAAPPFAGTFEGMDQQLVRALQDLPADYQTVLLLWALEEMPYKEISAALEIPIGTVMSRLHRARQKLGEQLREYASHQRIIRE